MYNILIMSALSRTLVITLWYSIHLGLQASIHLEAMYKLAGWLRDIHPWVLPKRLGCPTWHWLTDKMPSFLMILHSFSLLEEWRVFVFQNFHDRCYLCIHLVSFRTHLLAPIHVMNSHTIHFNSRPPMWLVPMRSMAFWVAIASLLVFVAGLSQFRFAFSPIRGRFFALNRSTPKNQRFLRQLNGNWMGTCFVEV